jgi:hypothetical protein
VDGVLTAVLGALPQVGALAGLVVLVVILIRREVQTTERHTAELDRQGKVYDAERGELLEENRRIREQRDFAELELREHWKVCRGVAGDPSAPARSS